MTPKTPHALDLIAGQYVLGVLSPSARRRLEAKLLQDSALMDAVHQWERLLNPLAHWLPDAPVPPGQRRRGRRGLRALPRRRAGLLVASGVHVRAALVTGAASGIGRATALKLAC